MQRFEVCCIAYLFCPFVFLLLRSGVLLTIFIKYHLVYLHVLYTKIYIHLTEFLTWRNSCSDLCRGVGCVSHTCMSVHCVWMSPARVGCCGGCSRLVSLCVINPVCYPSVNSFPFTALSRATYKSIIIIKLSNGGSAVAAPQCRDSHSQPSVLFLSDATLRNSFPLILKINAIHT